MSLYLFNVKIFCYKNIQLRPRPQEPKIRRSFPAMPRGAWVRSPSPRVHCGHVRARPPLHCRATAGKFQKSQNKTKNQYEAKPIFKPQNPGGGVLSTTAQTAEADLSGPPGKRTAAERELRRPWGSGRHVSLGV